MSGVDDGRLLSFSSAAGDGVLEPTVGTAPTWAVRIGRSEKSTEICLRFDTFSSRQHARLLWREARWWLEDCHSKNGTFIAASPGEDPAADEAQISGTIPLEPGQLFRVGRTWMRIQPGSALPDEAG